MKKWKVVSIVAIVAMLIALLNGNLNAFISSNQFMAYVIALVAGLQMGSVTYGVDLIEVFKNYKAKGVLSFYGWAGAWVIAFVLILAHYIAEM